MIVLDCCAAVAMLRKTAEGEALKDLMIEGESVVSSEFYLVEIRNVFWKFVQTGKLTEEEAREKIKDAIGLVDVFVPIRDNADEAFVEAVRQNHSVYDMFYLTLVRRTSGTLFSLDKKLVSLCEDMGLNVAVEVEI